MSLEVKVISASNVPKETFGKSDPYVNVEFQGIKKKTEVIKDEDNPVWNQSLVFDLQGNALSPADVLDVQVKDWEKIGRNKLLGQVNVPLRDVQKGSHAAEMDLPLQDANKRTLGATIKLKIVYNPPIQKQTAATTDAAPDTVDGGMGEEGGEEYDDEEGEEGGDVGIAGDGAGGVGGPGAPAGGGKKRRKRKNYRGKLSNKPQDFQVRIRVVEARQLQGSNIHPVAQVSVYTQMKQTHVKKSTNSPYWNEVFFCNFHASPAELFDELVEFKVFNSRKLRSDSLLGSFKFDIGMVYESPRHAMLNKWLLLTDPDDPMGGSKGYLKMSIMVLGPGDSAPDFKTVGKNEEEDIEANLLRPAGVKLRPGTFTLRLYRGEDIPRMDSDLMQGVKKFFKIGEEQKELVDPYVTFSFAGKEVTSRTLYNDANPEFNQELRLGIMFPSMCERVKLQVMDWDRVSEDDAIGAYFLPLSLISSPGESGFLPTFGPCFVNLYGSPREYSEMPDEYEHLNVGKGTDRKGEGCAYRGRLLIEMKTTLGELPEQSIDDINNDDVLRVQKYMRRRKFKLHVAFLSATMINATDAPVEFEVSIGNYGNKLDESVTPCASTTQPTNPIFDGNSYYYLPWGDTKPCVVVDSHWEDICWRLESLNMINKILIRLESHMKKVELSLKLESSMEEKAELLIKLLDQLIRDCSQPLPEPEPGRHIPNELDVHLKEHRLAELEFIKTEALKLRENATDVNEALQEVEGLAACLRNIAVEPQNCMPDVVFWMISGDKRIAFYRIPANDVLFSMNENNMGKDCGKISTLFLRWPSEKKSKDTNTDLPGVIRAKIWLGLEQHEMEWHKMQTAGELAVFAETYENQVDMPVVGWTNKGPALRRPAWSDSTGKLKLKKESFVPPPGWRWDGDWKVSPELSLQFDRDAGHKTFLEDVYEQQARYPGGAWGPSSQRPWADLKGDPLSSLEEFPLPEGWKWDDAWQADLNRAVDEEGWEYCVEATLGSYGPVEKTFHLCRRKRWVRPRTLVADMKKLAEKERQQKEVIEGWEYAPLFGMKFHLKERKMDMVRRRRWHRKMIAETKGASCFFAVQEDDGDKDKDKYATALAVPRMFLTFKTVQKYQLRAYLYQARELLAADDSGASDPYAIVSFYTQSQTTEKLKKTLCPTWDQTLLFEEIEIHGDPRLIQQQPPEVIIEFFDHDVVGNPDYLGRAISVPVVFLDPSQYRPTRLNWLPINRGNKPGGELLAAFELMAMTDRKDLPFYPPKKGDNYIVPSGIRPVMQRTAIEVLCWGVRNLKKYQLSSINSPCIEFECGEHLRATQVMRSAKKNPNFADPLLFFDVMLPKDELYMPPMNIKVRDHREFGRKPVVGRYSIPSLKDYRSDPTEAQSMLEQMSNGPGTPAASTSKVMGTLDLAQSRMAELSGKFRGLTGKGTPGTSTETDQLVTGGQASQSDQVVIEMPQEETGVVAKGKRGNRMPKLADLKMPKLPDLSLNLFKSQEKPSESLLEELDWWSKFYASIGDMDKCRAYVEKGYDMLEVYPNELEKASCFNEFKDFCETFSITKGSNDDEDEELEDVGELKATFRVYPLPGDYNAPIPAKLLNWLPPSNPEPCIVRVYIIQALDLQPNDPSGLADPYISIRLGKQSVNSRDDYVPNSINPVFGKMFELEATLPVEKDLRVRVKDYDLLTTDDLIGETMIDLENRMLTKHRAICGLPKSYCISGANQWRDSKKPQDLLDEHCKRYNLAEPVFVTEDSVRIGSKLFNLVDFESGHSFNEHYGPKEQRLALHVLNTFNLVPEHVESRPIYNPLQPGIEQGKLQMWVDIFPKSVGPPGPPVDIVPRKPKKFVIRCIIWNTKDVKLDEESITGEQMSDIYVKGWLAGEDDKQRTDVHYRSLDGEGNFNWRFIFPMEYLPAEQAMVIKEKEHFWSLDKTEKHVPPKLMIQIWDNDKFSADDFLGTLELDLNKMPKPTKRSGSCNLDQLISSPTMSLFEAKRAYGYWPCYDTTPDGKRELTGKVEMEVEIVTEEEAELKPAGKGQDEPNMNPHLDPPNRPDTSFLWFASPWKTLRYIVWRNYKWYIIGGLLLILLLVLVILFIYSIPGVSVEKIFGVNA